MTNKHQHRFFLVYNQLIVMTEKNQNLTANVNSPFFNTKFFQHKNVILFPRINLESTVVMILQTM